MASDPNWSELVPNCLELIFEHLSFTDFHSAKAVCSSWYSASKSCLPKQNQCPWLILFPHQNTETSFSCLLFNPEEGRYYRTRGLGRDFCNSRYMASSGDWLLMLGPQSNFYVVNIFSRERIGIQHSWLFRRVGGLVEVPSKAVLWVDGRTKDYVVVWTNRRHIMAFCKRGDRVRRDMLVCDTPSRLKGCLDMVYKDGKLYVCSFNGYISIFDFSGDFTRKVAENLCVNAQPSFEGDVVKEDCTRIHIAVDMSGDVLMVVNMSRTLGSMMFYVYKMNPKETKWEFLISLDGETLILDLGITLPTNSTSTIRGNSICLSTKDFDRLKWNRVRKQNNAGVYNITTGKTEMSLHFSPLNARWFIPSFYGK